jgi:hypothetical protein
MEIESENPASDLLVRHWKEDRELGGLPMEMVHLEGDAIPFGSNRMRVVEAEFAGLEILERKKGYLRVGGAFSYLIDGDLSECLTVRDKRWRQTVHATTAI